MIFSQNRAMKAVKMSVKVEETIEELEMLALKAVEVTVGYLSNDSS